MTPILAMLVVGCAGDGDSEPLAKALTWTIDQAACSGCRGTRQMELAAVRGEMKGDTDSCILVHQSGEAVALPTKEISLGEGEIVSLIAMVSCTTTKEHPGPDCEQLGDVCAADLTASGLNFNDPSMITETLCKPLDEEKREHCCSPLVAFCVKEQPDERCEQAMHKCTEVLQLLGIEIFTEEIEKISQLFERVCVQNLEPLDPATQCCRQAESCFNEEGKPPVEQSCSACYGSSSIEVDLDADFSLSLTDDVSCDRRPDLLSAVNQLRPCDL